MSGHLSIKDITECDSYSTFPDKAKCRLEKARIVSERIHQQELKKLEDKRKTKDRNNRLEYESIIRQEMTNLPDRLMEEIDRGNTRIFVTNPGLSCKYFPKAIAQEIKEKYNINLTCEFSQEHSSLVYAKFNI